MVAVSTKVRSDRSIPSWHAGFMVLMPQIREHAMFAFRRFRPENKQEAVQCVVAAALAAYVRLVELGKADIAYAAPLAKYAIRQYIEGRRLGSPMNVKDVSSEYAQKAKSITLERLDRYDHDEDCWAEVLVEDRHCGPFDIVRSKLDFGSWLKSLPVTRRRIAKALANGDRTCDVSRRFGLSAGRVSQVRRELAQNWHRFVGDDDSLANVPA